MIMYTGRKVVSMASTVGAGAGCTTLAYFDKQHIFDCAQRSGYTSRKYESKYACSTCGTTTQHCPPKLRCVDAVSGLRVAFVGDSLMAELSVVAACTLGTNWTTHAMPVVPHREALATLLRALLATADVIVVNFGLWFNFENEPDEDHVSHLFPSADYSTQQLEECIARPVAAPSKLAGNCTTLACLASPSTERGGGHPTEFVQLGFFRRSCPDNLGRHAYASDLARFVATLRDVAQEQRWRARRLVWRASTPQHYNTPGGLFPTSSSKWWPRAGACVPLRNPQLASARNEIADLVLAPLFRNPPNGLQLSRMSSFAYDIERYAEHPQHLDCSHFCMHSMDMWNWVRLLVQCLGSERDCGAQSVAEDLEDAHTDSFHRKSHTSQLTSNIATGPKEV